MTNEEFDQTYSELLNLNADFELGKEPKRNLELIGKRIVMLNLEIDLLYQSGSTEEEYLLIDLCYQYYRLRDRFSGSELGKG